MEMLLQPLASLLEVYLRPAGDIPATAFAFGFNIGVTATTEKSGLVLVKDPLY